MDLAFDDETGLLFEAFFGDESGAASRTHERVYFDGPGVAEWRNSVEATFSEAGAGLHGEYSESFKMDLGKGSLQFSFRPDNSGVDVDIDPNRGVRHGLDVIFSPLLKVNSIKIYNSLKELDIELLFDCSEAN